MINQMERSFLTFTNSIKKYFKLEYFIARKILRDSIFDLNHNGLGTFFINDIYY